MSAADCGAIRCSCAAMSTKEPKTLLQTLEFGWRNDDGSFHWKPGQDTVSVSRVWADHLRNRYQARLIEALPDGIIVQTHHDLTEAVTRIRWAAA